MFSWVLRAKFEILGSGATCSLIAAILAQAHTWSSAGIRLQPLPARRAMRSRPRAAPASQPLPGDASRQEGGPPPEKRRCLQMQPSEASALDDVHSLLQGALGTTAVLAAPPFSPEEASDMDEAAESSSVRLTLSPAESEATTLALEGEQAVDNPQEAMSSSSSSSSSSSLSVVVVGIGVVVVVVVGRSSSR